MAGHDLDNYEIDGIQWARVSSILPPFVNPTYTARQVQECTLRLVAGGMAWEEALEKAAAGGWEEHSLTARDVGKEAHDGIEARIAGTPFTPSCPEVEKVMVQFEDWRASEVDTFISSEMRVFNVNVGYAGTLDLIYKSKAGKMVLGDIKTSGAFYPNYLLQCSAYLMALCSMKDTPAVDQVKCIRFPKDGSKWAIKEYSEEEVNRGMEAFHSLATAYYLTAKRRLKNNPFVEKYWGKK